ncbi:TonB-linked SusC/RagA family outer membrane protein [Parabacteroides sp. PFB2-12]|nr:TonB-linked SusC/RagA family outer membrane protein [Parabacteroides sp. PM6-13]MDH6389400.1 TonB-linked SusC/RagA family outer membrane protein [Parabacteroides sp. PFB2-12]
MHMKTRLLMFWTLCLFTLTVWGQGSITEGRVVTASNNEPVIGATVKVKDAPTGVITDLDGFFSVNTQPGATLVISYVGYRTYEVKANGQKNLEIKLEEDTQILETVVVVGYGTAKKSDLTGAVVSANIKDFEKAPNTNLMQSLQGTVPGLNIGQSSTAGGSPSVQIRGKNTISGSTDVLIVLDGIIYTGDISSINPADIERVDVLKDASATAVYGAQAANGVLLITSKKGTQGKAKISFSSSYSFQSPTNDLKPMDRAGLVDWMKEVQWRDAYTENSGYTADNPNFDLAKSAPDSYMRDESGNLITTDYNWWDEFTRTGHIFENKLSISGGNESASYMLSVGNTDQKNQLLNDDFKRNSIRVNLDVQPRKWWKAGIQAFGSFVNKDGAETYLPFLVCYSPFAEPFDAEGNIVPYPMGGVMRDNPFMGSVADDKERQNTFFANLYSEFQLPLKGLTYRFNFGNNYRTYEHDYANKYSNYPSGQAYKNSNTYYDYTFDNILNYVGDFGKHSVGATFVYGASRRKYTYTGAEAKNFARLTLGYNSLEQGKEQFANSDAWQSALLYQMLRVNYKFANRYLVTATIRRDGFSGFAANNKFATFPSVALGWVASEESWFNVSWIDFLKVRAGYGVSGNQTGIYSSQARVNSGISYIFGNGATSGVLGQELVSLGNADLKWEKTGGFNFGLDLNMFNNRLRGTVEAYKTTTRDLLFDVTIPSVTGFGSIRSNVGKIQNTGVELTLTSQNISTQDFEWSTTFNISHNANKIKSLIGKDVDGDGIEDDMTASSLFIGESLSAIYDYKVDGIYQVGDDIPEGFYPGNYRVVDTDGNGTIDAADRTVIGKTDPAARMGLFNKLRYKNVTLSFFFNSVIGGKDGYLGQNTNVVRPDDNGKRYNHFTEEADLFWSPKNPGGIYDRSYQDGKLGSSPHRYEKRDFVRLQDVTLGYDLPRMWMQKIGIEGIHIYMNCKNLLTLTGWHGWDPEPDMMCQDGNGRNIITGSGYANRPVMKSITFGINVNF